MYKFLYGQNIFIWGGYIPKGAIVGSQGNSVLCPLMHYELFYAMAAPATRSAPISSSRPQLAVVFFLSETLVGMKGCHIDLHFHDG